MNNYIAIPSHEKELERVGKVLAAWVKDHEGDAYHNIENAEEKREVGNMIHDLNGFVSKIKQPQYRMPWELMEPLFYPKAALREISATEKESIEKALHWIGDGSWSIRHLEVMMGMLVSEIKKRQS